MVNKKNIFIKNKYVFQNKISEKRVALFYIFQIPLMFGSIKTDGF